MNLSPLRKKIDAIDQKMVTLLNERAQISLDIGREKLKNTSFFNRMKSHSDFLHMECSHSDREILHNFHMKTAIQ